MEIDEGEALWRARHEIRRQPWLTQAERESAIFESCIVYATDLMENMYTSAAVDDERKDADKEGYARAVEEIDYIVLGTDATDAEIIEKLKAWLK